MAEAATAVLTALPNELLDAVAALLDRAALCALALTCKKTNGSANAALYETYINTDSPSVAPFSLFLRTICEAPRLAELVKTVNVRGWRSEFEVATGAAWRGVETLPGVLEAIPERTKPSFSSIERPHAQGLDDYALFLRTAVRIGLVAQPTTDSVQPLRSTLRWDRVLENDKDFVRLLKNGVEDAQFILLCALLPNVGKLAVSGLSIYPTLDWYTFLSRTDGALQKVEYLAVCGVSAHPQETVLKSTMQILDILPNLRRIILGNMSVRGHRHTVDTLPTKTLLETSFYLCAIRYQLFKKMFAGQRVERLRYIPFLSAIETINAGASISEPEFTDALGSSKETIRAMSFYPTKPSEQLRIREYSHLRALQMPLMALLYPLRGSRNSEHVTALLRRALPSSLLFLKFRCCCPEDEGEVIVQQLARLKIEKYFPELKQIVLSFMPELRMLGPACLIFLQNIEKQDQDLLKRAGIRLEVNIDVD